MLLPEIAMWWAKTYAEMLKDERIGRIECMRFGDVPLTMERNRMVRVAKDRECDVLLMLDSDNAPDIYHGLKSWAKPFWQSSFDFLYERKMQGLPTVVVAPYCGPPPHPTKGGQENVYVFHGEQAETGAMDANFHVTAYSRNHAAQMRGIQSIAAGPTGVAVYSLDAFDLMPVHNLSQETILRQFKAGLIPIERAQRLLNMQSWFFYEYTNGEQTAKASTEDVTNTREIQLAGIIKHKQPIVFCNWDAWAGHYKPKCVGMPEPVFIEAVNDLYREAVELNTSALETISEMDLLDGEHGPILPADDEEVAAAVDMPPAANGDTEVKIEKRMVGGRVVTSVAHFTPLRDLAALTDIVKLVAGARPKKELRIVEVGSWVGESAIAMHAGLGPAGGTIYCVDTWEGTPTDATGYWADIYSPDKVFQMFLENIGDLIDTRVRVIKGESLQVAQDMEPQDLDMVFLDAGHDYDSVREDIEAWLPHVAPDGILCGHDFTESFPGVMRTVKECTDAAGMCPRVINDCPLWIISKKEYREGLAKKAAKKQKREKKEAVADEPVAANS